MTLTLTILRCPDGVPPETRHFTGGEFSIGRDPRNDWVLPDPERFLSKRHCVVSRVASGWQIVDTSTNGCYLNHEIEPIRGKPRGLRDGDRILLGSYELEVLLQGAEVPRYERAPPAVGGRANAAAFADDRLPGGPFAPAPLDPLALAVDAPVGLAAQYDPLAVGDAELGADPITQDRAFLDAAYRAPTISADLLPGDWDADNPPAAAPAPVFTPLMPPAPVITPLTPATPLALSAEREAPPVIPALTEPPAAMAPAAAAPDTAIAAFLRGAGINLPPGAVLAVGTIATLHGLGGAFRAMVHGLRRIMIARASIKGEFRIEQTMIRASGNNPLKFATDDKDALLALLHIGRRSNLTPEAAVADALLDIRLHEVAMMTAMRDAVRDLLAQYNPERLMEASDGRRSIVPSRRKARAWTTFEQHHRNILAALTDDFDSIFGKAFARSYERSMTEAQASQEAEIREKNERLGELGISPRNAPGDRL